MTVGAELLASVAAAALAGAAVSLLLRPRAGAEHPWLDLGPAAPDAPAGRPEDDPQDLLGRHRGAVSLLAGAAPVVLVGGVVGVVAGVMAALVVHRLLGKREPATERRRRELVSRGLPQVVDLLAVTLTSGASPGHALSTVAAAVEGPIADELRAAERGLALGRDPATVWREVAARPGLAALGRTMGRAVETGASVSDSLHRLAEDLHSSSRLEGESRARTVGVRAAAPLGLCLLPAFVLIGVVPLVAGTVAGLLGP